MGKFKDRSRESGLISKALAAFTFKEEDLKKKDPIIMKNDSMRAQELAKQISAKTQVDIS